MTHLVDESTKLTGEFVLWHHSITNSSWDKDSYDNICVDLEDECIKTTGDLVKVYSAYHNNVSAGMFFLMRKGILPMWEDPNNLNGGYWSFKVPKRSSNDIWLQLTAAFVGNTLLNDIENMDKITGISVSPKISNCVMKVWSGDKSFNSKNVFCSEVEYLEPSSLMFKSNK